MVKWQISLSPSPFLCKLANKLTNHLHFLVDSDIASEEERLLLMTSDEELATPLNTRSIFEKSERRFTMKEINSREYHREVRRILNAKMDTEHALTGVHYHSFCRRFEREHGIESNTTKPDFDAWCLVIGKSRKKFDTRKFLKVYKEAKSQILYIRDKLNIQVSENF